MRNLVSALAASMVCAAVVASPAVAKSGGGGGGGGGGSDKPPKVTLPTPAIPPGTFEGIGPGPVYIRESFGHAQRTRYTQSGSIIDAVDKPEINGIRAEFPNNRTETWAGTRTSGAASWKLSVTGPGDPLEPYTPLQDTGDFGIQDGTLSLVGSEVGGPDDRPAALLPFAAPTDTEYTVSAETVYFLGKTAIGFSNAPAANRNFETNGQAWLEVDTSGRYIVGGNTGITRWTFHTGDGTVVTGTYDVSLSTGFNQIAVSYDPVGHIATASIDGVTVASVPYTASVSYVGVEGTWHANVDNFTVRAGT
jgi:hypothetical protein